MSKNITETIEQAINTITNGDKMSQKEKEDHYSKVILSQYKAKGEEPPEYLEPDFFDGWH